MPVDKNRIQKFENNKVKNVRSKNVDEVNMELLLTMNETTEIIQNSKCKDAVPYILWNDFVNKKGTLAQKLNTNYNRYIWGQKIFVNFGMSNIQTELSYPHPAILLYNFANTAIVVPTTTDDKITAFSSDIEECIIKVKSDGIIFPHDSIINIHQICSVHKERIISDLKCNIKNFIMDDSEIDRLNSFEDFLYFPKNISLLECINLKLSLMYNANFIRNLYTEAAYNVNEILTLKRKLNELEEKYKKLQKSIDKESIK